MGGEYNKTMAPASMATYPQLASKPVGKQITPIYKDRLRQFIGGGQYSKYNLIAKIDEARISGSDHVKLHVWSAPDLTRPTFEEATKKDNEYRKTKKGESFGPSWSTHWFKVQFTVPEEWVYKPHVEFHWDSNSEAMVWTDDGKPLQGLTGGH